MSPETNSENDQLTPSDTTQPDGASLSVDASEPASAPLPAPEKISRRLLAVDTALGACSVAVFDLDRNEPLIVHSLEITRGHAEALLPMIESAMQKSGTPFEALSRIVTTTGPGSFTGLRVGIAAARGLALACHKPAVGISTLAAFSAPYVTTSDTMPVVAVIDALHGNIYFQMTGAAGRVLVSPRVSSIEQALRQIAVGPVRIVGSGANLLASHWPSEIAAPSIVDQKPAPDIIQVAQLGAAADPEKAKPRPLYLKAPDAQPQTAHRLPRK